MDVHNLPTPNKLFTDFVIEKILHQFKFSKETFFLEIGCGTGEFLYKMGNMGNKGWGIDISEKAVGVAQKRVSNLGIDVFQKDIFEIEESNKFNVIFAFEILEHIEDDIAAMQKVYQLLEPEGKFILTTPGRKDLYNQTDIALGHIRRYEKEELITKLRKAGFKIILFWSWGVPIFSKIRAYFVKQDMKEHTVSERTQHSSYSRPGYSFIKKIYPIYSSLFFIYKLQRFFLESNHFNCHYLVVCEKI